ncbi:MAG: tyrosine-type recombinase/integrase, partial [Verrucomicrobia bacterium]|nr:tyrosine-type recombinase/integrase [Verrucomicrobiota bacterium]
LMIRNRILAPPKASDEIRNIDDLIADYLAWGNTQGGRRGHPWAPEHARKKVQGLKFWKAELKLRTQVDLIDCQPRVERVIHRLCNVDRRSGKATWNKVETLAAFGRWCLDRGYLDEDPLRRLKKINTDPVRRRRALTADEITKLLGACLPERTLLYETALCTGLRANELRHITPAHLDDKRCGIRLEAAWTKNRMDGFQPIPRWLMNKLLAEAQAMDHSAGFFMVQKTHPARMIQDDLKRAGIPLEIPTEGKVDFHSLRVTFCTLLDDRGASAKENQELARHSTPALTMNIYVRTRVDSVRSVVDAVGAIVNPETAPYPRLTGETPHLTLLRNTA